MPIYRVGTNIYATHLFHQGIRHGYTGGSRNTAGYGQTESRRIAQPSPILTARLISSNRFPEPWTLPAPITGWRKLQYFTEPPTADTFNKLKYVSEPPVPGAWNKLAYEGE